VGELWLLAVVVLLASHGTWLFIILVIHTHTHTYTCKNKNTQILRHTQKQTPKQTQM
jgi:hypothetical protein